MDEQQPLTRDAIRYVDDRPPQLELTAKDRPNDLTATKDWTAAQLRACLSAAQCYQAQYDLLRGQPFYQLDLRVSKGLRFGDIPRLKLIFQAFDVTNRANFGNNYVGDVRNSNII